MTSDDEGAEPDAFSTKQPADLDKDLPLDDEQSENVKGGIHL